MREADVVVVGFGFAGGIAAIEAADAGAEVILLEKMRDPGGISVCSAGGIRVTRDARKALIYLEATNGGTTPTSVLKALADGMTEVGAYMKRLGDAVGAVVSEREADGNYPFEGYDVFGFSNVDEIPGVDLARAWPHVRGSPAGARMFKVVHDNVRMRSVEVHLDTPVRRLIRENDKVVGVETDRGPMRARRAVVLATGGFEADHEMQKQFWQLKPVLSAAVRCNTGDGIRMAQAVGASLWHMWHFHGCYGFRHSDPNYPFGIRLKRLPDWLPGKGARGDVRMAWIIVNRTGKRFMNEYHPYLQDTGHRPMDHYEPELQDYPNVPGYLIVDDEGRKLYPLGAPTYNDRNVSFAWSRDNLAEVDLGILKRANSVEEMAAQMKTNATVLARTLADWNRTCAAGRDPEFGRPPSSMIPIAKPPFFWGEVWPVVSNTQGGPAHDERQRVLDAFGEPIPGLYAAGELGSVFGHLYMSGSNLAECFIGGRIAGREAAKA
ncbi:MAG: FAD-dependent oxidoreductase [Alphaproteobacteria bacterium]|nr:FAD-dependent oxidoreductase [Alphaproteobacteria bacterium]